MTAIEKEKIRYFRGEGLGYKAIASRLGLTESAVKGFCKRNGLDGEAAPNADTTCRQCGQPLEKSGARRKKFCSDGCRALWWSHHPYLVEPKTENERACLHCGRVFYSGPGKGRKYCGRPCYVTARFGGDHP